MNAKIESTYTREKAPGFERLDAILNLSENQLDACLKNMDAQGWFLEDVFKHRYDTEDDRVRTIVMHPNCPIGVLALVDTFQPDWLVDSPALAKVQLMELDPAQKGQWLYEKRFYGEKQFFYLFRLLYLEEGDYLQQQYKSNSKEDTSYNGIYTLTIDRELFRRLPKFLLHHLMEEDPDQTNMKRRKEVLTSNQDAIALLCDTSFLDNHLKQFTPRMKTILTTREDLPEKYLSILGKDKSAVVRKAVAKIRRTPVKTLRALTKDNNQNVAELALKSLPEDMLDKALDEKANSSVHAASTTNAAPTIVSSTVPDSNTHHLTILHMPTVDPESLVAIAAKAEPLLACAATLHRSATKAVVDAAEARTDLADWAQIGIALKTDNVDLLTGFAASKNTTFHLAVSDNPYLTESLALDIVEKTENDRVLANIANLFIENDSMLDKIVKSKPESAWIRQLQQLRFGSLTQADFREIFSGSAVTKYLVLGRLLARHPEIPKARYAMFAFYLPEDIVKNPQYKIEFMDKGKSVKPKPLEKKKIDKMLEWGQGHEFLYCWLVQNNADMALQRMVISSHNNNPNAVRHLAILNDAATHKRFIHSKTQTYSEYEHRVLARFSTPVTQKAMIEADIISDLLLQEMAQSEHKVVAMAAQKLANKRGLSSEVDVDKRSLNSLGNKAAREVLARESMDLDVLQLMVEDKVKTIRSSIACRAEIDTDSLLKLAKDPEENVVVQALQNLSRRDLNQEQNARYQEILKKILLSTNNPYLLKLSFAGIEDGSFKDALFTQERNTLNNLIIETTKNQEILDLVSFEIERGSGSFSRQAFLGNPYANAEIKRNLIQNSKVDCQYILMGIKEVEGLINVYKDFREEMLWQLSKTGAKIEYKLDAKDLDKLYESVDLEFFCFSAKRFVKNWPDEKIFAFIDAAKDQSYFNDALPYMSLPEHIEKYPGT